jgi:nucleotidyltransferase substrate binding protein (TIGR01987 family)
MQINTDHFARCVETLKSSLLHLQNAQPESVEYEVFRNATVKGFELTLETAGKLLRRALKTYTGNPRTIDELTYKDVLRHAVKHGLLSEETAKRWFIYRDNRNDTAHDYGINFAKTTLKLLPDFLADAHELQLTLEKKLNQKNA